MTTDFVERARALRASGRLTEAIAVLDSHLAQRPDDGRAHGERALCLARRGEPLGARDGARRLAVLGPGRTQSWRFIAALEATTNQLSKTIQALRITAILDPLDVDAKADLAEFLRRDGRIEDAVTILRVLAEAGTANAQIWTNLGAALRDRGQQVEAIDAYHQALALLPTNQPATRNLLELLLQAREFEAVARLARRALVFNPDEANAWTTLALSEEPSGRTQDMVDHLARACVLEPKSTRLAYWRHLALPPIARSKADIEHWRRRFRQGIQALEDQPEQIDDATGTFDAAYFYLAYHGQNNRELVEALGQLMRSKAPILSHRARHIDGWRPPAQTGRRIRLGILSRFLSGHTIGQLYRGLIRHLDKSRFEVTLIHLPRSSRDLARAEMNTMANAAVTLPTDLEDQQRRLCDLALDVLFFPDVGMTPESHLLAFARSAPVQVVSWGHPDTTGLSTIDYFISADNIEAHGADDHYTERLIRLNRLPCFYEPPDQPPPILSRAELSLPGSGTLYGCPQSLFKIHPDFDPILAAIAAGDPDGHILLSRGGSDHWKERLRARWADRHPILLDRVIFLPPRPHREFLALLRVIDVLLDPPHFGGGSTLYEAMLVGTPTVTWPGAVMRARIAGAAYRQMEIPAPPIAARLDDYAPLAMALGRDQLRRATLRQALSRAGPTHLFSDHQVAREFESFLTAALDAAARGDRLPMGWRPGDR